MIIVTGAYGFIGSFFVEELNRNGFTDILPVDDFSKSYKQANLKGLQYFDKIDRERLFTYLDSAKQTIDAVFHLGARTDTTEFDTAVFERLNLNYSKNIWQYCSRHKIPLIYASSAATYGDGSLGYDDNHRLPFLLHPLNPYGVSKNDFDKWALQQEEQPPYWYGMKFFNVYGPKEYHKGRMASVIFHAFHQIRQTGKMKLFKSHRPDYEDGMQLRDFVYVKDVASVLLFMMQEKPASGLYNLGTGQARSFLDLVKATFAAMEAEEDIQFIDMPEDIRDKYQYYTEAKMQKLREAGYRQKFYSLEEGVADYVRNHLMKHEWKQ